MPDAIVVGQCRHGLTWKFCKFCKGKTRPRGPGVARVVSRRQADIMRHPSSQASIAHINTQCPWCDTLLVEGIDFVHPRAKEWVCEQCAVKWDIDNSDKGEK